MAKYLIKKKTLILNATIEYILLTERCEEPLIQYIFAAIIKYLLKCFIIFTPYLILLFTYIHIYSFCFSLLIPRHFRILNFSTWQILVPDL